MTKFNKGLLTAAVVGALALSSNAFAADFYFGQATQITYAKDLIVNDGTTIQTPANLRIAARSQQDGQNVDVLTAGEEVTVKVTLTNGAKFDATADAHTLVDGFILGNQFTNLPGWTLNGGTLGSFTSDDGTNPAVVQDLVVGTPYYSASGQELNFTFRVPVGAQGSNVTLAPSFFLELNSFQITNLASSLGANGTVGAEITVQNGAGVPFLAGSSLIAKSKWGLETALLDSTDPDKTIDVAGIDPKHLFSPDGSVGGSDGWPLATETEYFNLGGVTLLVASDATVGTGGGAQRLVNNFNAVASNPNFNVVGTSVFTLTVAGNGLDAYKDASDTYVWLSDAGNCSSVNNVLASSITNNSASFTLNASSPLLAQVTSSTPGESDIYVCAGVTGGELSAVEPLTVTTAVDYKLPTQRVNPTLKPQTISGIDYNGTTLIFQNVNPGGNLTAQSMLRLTNNNASACSVEIDAKDDAGLHSDVAKITLDAHKSIQLLGEDLEGGNAGKGLTGGFGDGTGKWYVRVTAQCTNFKASALNRNVNSGTVTDLTAEKHTGWEWLTPATKLNP